MPSKILQPKSKSEVDLCAECHFLAVPHDELEACFYYEYAREVPGFAAVVERRKSLTDSEANHFPAGRVKERSRPRLRRSHGVSIFEWRLAEGLSRSAFPLPWQQLSGRDKSYLRTALPALVLSTAQTIPLWIVEGNPFDGFERGEQWYLSVTASVGSGAIRHGSFAINLAVGAPAIIERFKFWVNEQIRNIEPSEKALISHASVRKPGQTAWKARLNQLGALRWRYFGLKEYPASFGSAISNRRLSAALQVYRNDSGTLNRAVNEALVAFAEMFPDREPLHFTPRGWGSPHAKTNPPTPSIELEAVSVNALRKGDVCRTDSGRPLIVEEVSHVPSCETVVWFAGCCEVHYPAGATAVREVRSRVTD